MRERSTCSRDWKECRRLRALHLFNEGYSQANLARIFGVSKAAVCQWIRAAEQDGPLGLAARPRPGAYPKIDRGHLRLLPDLLSHGAESYGFLGELWTSARVALVIEREFGVKYHKRHVARLLKDLDWTPQKPLTQAAQRDEQEIAWWQQHRWAALKKSSPEGAKKPDFIG